MARYTKQWSQRLGSFEGYETSSFGDQFGQFNASQIKCTRPSYQLIDQELIDCYYESSAPGNSWATANIQNSLDAELRRRNYEFRDNRWQKIKEETSAAEVMTGIAAILNPLATAGVGIFQATQQAKLAKLQLKHGGGISSQPVIIQSKSNTGVIFAVVFVIIIMMVMMFMMNKR